MKKNKLIKLLFTFCLPILVVSCAEDIGEEKSPKGTGTDFETLSSSILEIGGTATVTIPFRNGSFTEADISLTGTAIEGEDYEFVGITSEGIQINVIDDNNFEPLEFVKIVVGTTGNNVHTVTIESNCEDNANPYDWYFVSDWAATEFYCGLGVTTGGCDFGPYAIHLEQDGEDPNTFRFDNFYGSGCDAYMIFDLAAGTVYFPDQAPCGVDLTASTGTFTIDECGENTTLIINLNFDGGDWIYEFVRI